MSMGSIWLEYRAPCMFRDSQNTLCLRWLAAACGTCGTCVSSHRPAAVSCAATACVKTVGLKEQIRLESGLTRRVSVPKRQNDRLSGRSGCAVIPVPKRVLSSESRETYGVGRDRRRVRGIGSVGPVLPTGRTPAVPNGAHQLRTQVILSTAARYTLRRKRAQRGPAAVLLRRLSTSRRILGRPTTQIDIRPLWTGCPKVLAYRSEQVPDRHQQPIDQRSCNPGRHRKGSRSRPRGNQG